ncbi:MAG: nucleotidyltransferase domain-containing protein [Anaerolineales bacterium]|nr:nucleotidyltransferase domain-containing protein [Anaerolineales bacterium]
MAQSALQSRKTSSTKIRLPRAAKLTLANFQERALAMFPDAISRIILYGSYARGEETADSDLDVMVVVRKDKQPVETYIGGPGDIRWRKLVDAGIDSLVNEGPFVSVLVVGEDVFQSKFSVSQAAREEGLELWTAQPR